MAVTTDTSVTELLATYKDSSDTAITDTFGYLNVGNAVITKAGDIPGDILKNAAVRFNYAITNAMGNDYTNSKIRQTIILEGLPNNINEEV